MDGTRCDKMIGDSYCRSHECDGQSGEERRRAETATAAAMGQEISRRSRSCSPLAESCDCLTPFAFTRAERMGDVTHSEWRRSGDSQWRSSQITPASHSQQLCFTPLPHSQPQSQPTVTPARFALCAPLLSHRTMTSLVGPAATAGHTLGAGVLAAALKHHGVQFMFGVVGIPIVEVGTAAQEAGLQFVGFRNEQAASYAAGAASYLTAQPQACLVVSGPGVSQCTQTAHGELLTLARCSLSDPCRCADSSSVCLPVLSVR